MLNFLCPRGFQTVIMDILIKVIVINYYYYFDHIESNTWACGDMKFLFECSTRCLKSERSERVRYRVAHEKSNSISPSNHVSFYLLYKHLTNKKKSALLTFQKENALPFIRSSK